jgi:hypothetical protein
MPGKPASPEIVKTIGQRIFLFFAIVALLAALGRFAYLRFQSGDAYPPYSSFRTDPIGTKALYESLRRIEPSRVRRNVQPLENFKDKAGATILLFGIEGVDPDREESLLRDIAHAGGHIIVALDARHSRAMSAFQRGLVTPAPPLRKGGTNTNFVAQINFNKLFGFDLITLREKEATNGLDAIRVKDHAMLAPNLQWYGRYVFSARTNNWESIYEVNGRPVVLQQKFGLGSIVLIADTFPFSNEALRAQRDAGFLLWVLGGREVIFDESHLGIRGGTSVAVLMREFRLHGLIIGCVLLAMLWIWRNGTPLVPPPQVAEESGEQAMEGKTARQAVVHLLRKNLSGADALRAGLDEWTKTHPPHFYWEQVRLKEANELVQRVANSRQPGLIADAQRKLSELLFPKQR